MNYVDLAPKFPGYFVSEDGDVLSKKNKTSRILKQQIHHKNEYRSVCLRQGSVTRRVLIHRLVAFAFLGLDIDDERIQVNHKDGDKGNNRKSNLELTDNAGNHQHAFDVLNRRPTWLGKNGSSHSSSKKFRITFPDGQIEVIDGLLEFCRKHNLRQPNMSQVAAGKQSHHKGFKCERITQ